MTDAVKPNDPDRPPPAPRWVKVLGVIALVIVVVFAMLHLAGRGFGGH